MTSNKALSWVTFTASLMAVIGGLNFLWGLIAVWKPLIINADAQSVFGSYQSWGWATMAWGIVLILVAGGLLTGNTFARFLSIALVVVSMIGTAVILAAYPVWGVVTLAIAFGALWGLTFGWPAEELEASNGF